MIINHNLMGMNTHRQLGINNANSARSIEKLSSGLRINRAGDDAAGLAISEKMRAQVRGLNQASRNAQDGISMIQTAEGALNETQAILQRMRELAVQAANDTNTADDRGEIQKEINQLTSEVNRIGNTTEFNTKKLLNGDMASVVSGSTTTTKTTTKDGTYKPNYAEGLTWTGQTGDKPVIADGGGNDNQIAFTDFDIDASNKFEWSKMDASKTNTISIERSGDTILVDIAAEDSTGNKVAIDNDKMAFDQGNGKFVYDANGVKFEITKAEFDKMTDGAKVDINLSAYDIDGTPSEFDLTGATVGTVSDYKQTLAGGTTSGVFATGVKVDTTNAEWIDGVAGIKITGTTLEQAGAGTLKIELLASDGSSIATEEFTGAAAAGNITYNNHGVSFEYTVNNTSNLNLEMKFDTTTKTETATTTTDNSAKFQIGANAGQSMSVGMSDMRSLGLNVSSGTASSTKTVTDSMGNNVTASYTATQNVTNGTNNTVSEYALDVSSADNASAAVKVFDESIAAVSSERSKLGAFQNRLEHSIKNLDASSENLQSAESRIRDVDMAKEMMNQSKNSILSQAAQAMLAQAKQAPQAVLQLLR